MAEETLIFQKNRTPLDAGRNPFIGWQVLGHGLCLAGYDGRIGDIPGHHPAGTGSRSAGGNDDNNELESADVNSPAFWA